MHIAGLQKTSLIDYPGRISCVVFTQGCNFHCPYCHNPDLIPAKGHLPLVEQNRVEALLEERNGFLEAVVITGGEPTIHPDLAGFCDRIKALGYALKLDTNGSNPDGVNALIDAGLVDYIAMDIKTDPARYEGLISEPGFDSARIGACIERIIGCGIDHEFRLTCVRPLIDEAIMERIARRIQGAGRLVLQQCRPGRVLDPGLVTPAACLDLEQIAPLARIAAGRVKDIVIR